MLSTIRSPFPISSDWASLILRLTFGGVMALNHGWGKLQSYPTQADSWADPIGLGGPASLILAITGEFVCGILIALGLFTRLAVLPAGIVMIVAILAIHWNEPFSDKEHALLYLMAYAAIFWLGSGRYSLDAVLARR